MKLPEVVGVVGAGTMGAGIAQLAAAAGARTLLHDPVPEALERGVQSIRKRSQRAPCGLVIEAAPERLELKRELFCALAEALAPDAILATNTSSLSVTAIA